MLNSRRAIVAAFFILVVFFLLTRSHNSLSSTTAVPETAEPQPETASRPQPKPGSDSKSKPSKDDAATQGGLSSDEGLAEEEPFSHVSSGDLRPKPIHRRPQNQKPMLDTTQMSTYDKLAYAYPYDVEAKFPAYIWQTWKYSVRQHKFAFRDQEKSWSDQHPGFVHEVITDDTAVNLLRLFYASVPEVLEAFHALPRPVLKADFFRYLILYARGGIYSDIDTYALQSALNWLPANVPRSTVGLVIGIEADPDRPDWADWYSRRIQFCQWTIQSKPGHPVLRDIISRITSATLDLKESGKISSFDDNKIVDFTGPAIWTDTIMDYFNDDRFFDMSESDGAIDWHNFTGMEASKRVGDVVVLPITSFSPGVQQMGAKEADDPMAFVQHDFEGTWKPESGRHIGEQTVEKPKEKKQKKQKEEKQQQ